MKSIKYNTNIRTTWGGVLLNRKGIIPIFVVILTILIIMISMGYAALNKNLSISGEAFLRSRGNVRITGIKMNTTESDGNFTYNPEYSKRGTKVFSILPNIDSKINYTVQMNNTTGVKYKFDSVTVSNTNSNVECLPSVAENTIIEPGVSSFEIEVKYKDGITMDEKTDICEIKYEFSAYDVTPPTIRIETITDGETSKTVKITAVDDEEGSGLSEENNYKYYLSTSNTELTGGEWKDYTNKEEFTIEGKNQTKYLWIYPVQDKAGNISDDKTGITESYFLQEYNFISTYTVSYIGNKFSTTAKVENGVTVTYDQDTSILTLNGNPTNDIVNLMLLNQTFNENDQFKITLDYISGTFTSSGEFTFSGEVVIATDIKNSSNENVSTRNWADIFLPTATISNPSGILTTTSIGANEGSYLSVMLWMKSPSTTTFTNYKVKVNITKVDTKRVKYNQAYGILGDTPTREDYTFDGWYTEEIGGTKVTSDTIMTTESDHNIYAHWKPTTYTVTYNGNKFSTTAKVENGVTVTYDQDTSILTLNGNPTNDIVNLMLLNQTFNENDQFKITLDYISGTFTSSGEFTFSGEVVIATDIKNSSNENVSTRNWADIFLPTATISNPSGILTTTSIGANEGSYLSVMLWMKSPSTTTFTNYKVKVNITKVDTKRVKYNHAYGTLGDTPTREGYTFDGWYTKEIGGTKVTSDTIVSAEGDHTLYAHWVSSKPTYTYTGSSQLIDDGNGNWRIKFLTSGMLTLNDSLELDIFLVGGGSSSDFITGGTGGQTLTKTRNIAAGTYEIVIGNGGAEVKNSDGYYSSRRGENTTAFGITAEGGSLGGGTGSGGGCGNSAGSGYGGAGGSDGNAGGPTTGGNTCTVGRRGQGYTTREFGEPDGKLYAGGGGGYGASGSGAGGSGGGGNSGVRGEANTGGGGGAVYSTHYRTVAGGSGIVIIRNSRGKQAFDYDYTGRSILIDEGNGNWKLKFLTSGTLTTYENANIDVFLVGGGSSSEFITGGSGGQTLTESTSLPISSYDIVIGAGGTGKADGDGYYKSSSGGSSSAFGFTAIGGKPSGGTGSGGGCGNSAGSGYGGAGGSDGGAGGPTKGGNTCTVGRRGQGTTTREFGEPDGKLYAGGGGGFGVSGSGAGGAGGGGKGGSTGEINTGGGGGAVYSSKYRCVAGGSGIVIIRNQR